VRQTQGFTLIELLVTVAMVAVLAAVGVPAYETLIQNSRAAALANGLTTAFGLARSEAVKRATPVAVCPSSDGATCNTDWATGWIVRVVATNEVLRGWPAVQPGSQITQTPTVGEEVRFGALGLRESAVTTFRTTSARCRGERARVIQIGGSGRVTTARQMCP
jgi:type IV fimbrial biogenesis protein FimT